MTALFLAAANCLRVGDDGSFIHLSQINDLLSADEKDRHLVYTVNIQNLSPQELLLPVDTHFTKRNMQFLAENLDDGTEVRYELM